MAAVININEARPGATAEDWSHFDLVLGLTADLLPVVSNPRAVVAPESTLKAIGKTPSRYNSQRQAVGMAKWTEHVTTPAEVAAWSRERDYGICLQTRRVRALDVDVDDPGLAALIYEHLAEYGLPMRSRANAAKFLLAFELPGEFHKRRIKCTSGMVEFLAQGQQAVVVGMHPSGVRYEWAGGLPDAFPVLSAAQFEALWTDLAANFGVEAPTESGASVKAQKLADAAAADPVAQFLLNAGRVKRTERDGRLHITCPFEAEHTSESGETSTTYFPAHTGGYAQGHFQCLHAHCEHRSDADFLEGVGYVDEGLLEEFSAIAAPAADPDAPMPITDKAEVLIDQPAAKSSRFRFITVAEFLQGSAPTWLIKGVVPKATLGVLFGEPGSGKSFIALDMAFDVAQGLQWRGMRTKQARVAYIIAEGAAGFRYRLRAICHQRGIDPTHLPIKVLAAAPNFMDKAQALEVARELVAAGGADLVFVDTFAQVMPGANENSGEDVGRALEHCRGLHITTGAMVVLVHHSGKDSARGARGWSGLKGAADVELEVVNVEGRRSIAVTKMKDGPSGVEYAFRLSDVVMGQDADGDEITSCIVEHGDGQVRRLAQRGPKGAIEKLVLNVMEDLAGLAEGVVPHVTLKEAAKAQMPYEEGSRDTRGQRIERALESLIAARHVVREGAGLRIKSQEIAG